MRRGGGRHRLPPKAIAPLPGTPSYRKAYIIAAADEANEPHRFTAFIGYEWTSTTAGNNLHRNVIFRDDGSKARLVEPLITQKPLGSDDPRDLWKWMEAYEEKTAYCAGHRVQRQSEQRFMFPLVDTFHRQVR